MSEKPTPIRSLADVLRASEPRPSKGADAAEQRRYAKRFADHMARLIARGFRKRFKKRFEGILPDDLGHGLESLSRSARGPKRLDINFSTPQLGLGLGISLKSVHIRETRGAQGYTHNRKRND